MTIDLTEIALAILSLIGTIITTKLIPYLQSKYSKDQLERACKAAEIAVNAAEQLAKNGIIKPEERKQYAMNSLAKQKIRLDLNQLDDIVESFVLKLPKFIIKSNDNIESEDDIK